MSDADPLYDVQEAGVYLGGISRATVYRLVADGKLAIQKVRGQTRFRQSELDRYLRDAQRNRVA